MSSFFELLFLNLSYYFMFYIFNYKLMFFLNMMYIWFIYLILLIFFFVVFLFSKKLFSFEKKIVSVIFYLFVLLFVCLLMVTEEFLSFLMFFESLFLPVVFSSLMFSFSNRFIFALYYLIFYSGLSSMCCLLTILLILFHFSFFDLLLLNDFCFFDSMILFWNMWFFFIIIFGIKFPIWPLHSWLPEVHVEVTTEFSAILASIVLKMGFFGFYKFVYLIFNIISIWMSGVLDFLMFFGIFYLSFHMFFISDYKKLIAFWSVIHTGMSLILLWQNDLLFLTVLFFCNLAHILSSGFMFTCIGFIYENFGLSVFLILNSFFGISMWSNFFLFLFLFNIDFPFTLLFYVDIFVCYGMVTLSFVFIVFFLLMVFLVFLSTLYIYINLVFYNFVWLDKYLSLDLSINDMIIFLFFSLLIFEFFFLIYSIF